MEQEIEQEESMSFKDWIASMSFPILILIAILVAASIGGAVKSGMFMGFMSTIAIWCFVIKFPMWLKKIMANHVLLTDLILSVLITCLVAPVIGSGPTVFMAAVTQAVMLSLLLTGLKVQQNEA